MFLLLHHLHFGKHFHPILHLLVLIISWCLYFQGLLIIIIAAFAPSILLLRHSPLPIPINFANHLLILIFNFIIFKPALQQLFFIIFLINFIPFLFPHPTIHLNLSPIHFLYSFGNTETLFLQQQLQNILQDKYSRYLEPIQFVCIIFVSLM